MSSFQPAGSPHGALRRDSSDEGLGTAAFLGAVRRFRRSILALALAGFVLGLLASVLQTPVYEAQVTFFAASSQGDDNSALENDEYVQRRINSYVGVVTSESVADMLIEATGVDLDRDEMRDRITASVDPDTVLLRVAVRDTSPQRAEAIATALTDNLNEVITGLESGPDSNIRLSTISGPTVLPDPVSPRTALNAAVGLLIGFAAGLAQAILRHQYDRSFRSRDDLATDTGLPVLGVVPFDGKARRSPVLTEPQMHTNRAEALRQLRTSLRFIDAARPAKVVVVSSATEDEGKTTTAANLAVTLAVAGDRVLLVDADLRKPSVDRYLDIESGAGLTNALVDRVPVERLIQSWPHYGLDVLASGPLPPNPSELLGSPTMAEIIAVVRSRYDTVIIDAPPILPVTDATVLASQVDGVILVVRYGDTPRDRVHHSIETLRRVNAAILGTVLTMSKEPEVQESSSYYRTDPPGRS